MLKGKSKIDGVRRDNNQIFRKKIYGRYKIKVGVSSYSLLRSELSLSQIQTQSLLFLHVSFNEGRERWSRDENSNGNTNNCRERKTTK